MAASEAIFKALAEPTRQRLLSVLSRADLTVSELVQVLGLPQSTVSRHLRVLREAGLLVDRRVGTRVTYAALPTRPHGEDGRGSGRRQRMHSGTRGTSALRNQLLDWAGCQEIGRVVSDRLDRLLALRKAESADFFSTLGSRWDKLRIEAFGQAFHLEAMMALLPRHWTAVDIGAGTGYLLEGLTRQFDKVIAVDPSERTLDVARSRPELEGRGNLEFRIGTLEQLPLADGEADLLVASLVLHHVENPAEAMPELRRAVRDGGQLLIVEQAEHEHQAFYEQMGDRWWGFEPTQLAEWLTAAGFEDVRHQALNSAIPTKPERVDVPMLFAITAKK